MYLTYFATVPLLCFSTFDIGQPLFFYQSYVYDSWVHFYLVLFHCCVAEASSLFIHAKCVFFTHGFCKCLCLSPWATMTQGVGETAHPPFHGLAPSFPSEKFHYHTQSLAGWHPKPDVDALQINSHCFKFSHCSSRNPDIVQFASADWFSPLGQDQYPALPMLCYSGSSPSIVPLTLCSAWDDS